MTGYQWKPVVIKKKIVENKYKKKSDGSEQKMKEKYENWKL